MAILRVLVGDDGKLQVFTDGEDLTEEDGARATLDFLARLGARVPGGIRQDSAVEGHRDGGMDHAHIVARHEQGRG
jgi:hypothetical protein